jgi:23S rRNA-intervening sequence protein
VKIKTYFELEVWQKAHELALLVFRVTDRFSRADQFGIVSQVRRSCSSVAANIAEGFGRGNNEGVLTITPDCARGIGGNQVLHAIEPRFGKDFERGVCPDQY